MAICRQNQTGGINVKQTLCVDFFGYFDPILGVGAGLKYATVDIPPVHNNKLEPKSEKL